MASDVTKAPDFSNRYSNYFALASGLYDFRLLFGLQHRSGPSEDGDLKVEYFQGIFLSPQEAVVLSAMLSDEIKAYEKRFGSIPRLAEPKPEPAQAQADEIVPSGDGGKPN